jgi:hypothetical protein
MPVAHLQEATAMTVEQESIQVRYLARVNEENAKRQKFLAVQSVIAKVAKALNEDPQSFSFENCNSPAAHRFPAKITENAQKWPSADQLQTTLNDWLKAREDLLWLWDKMIPHERQGLAAPLGWKSTAA